MALDLTGAFTLGALDPGRGNGVSVLMMSGELVGLDGTGTYAINLDGTVTASGGGADADLSMDFGCGQIIVTNYDADGTGAGIEGAVAEVEFVFGSSSQSNPDADSGGLEIIGGIGNFGVDIGSGTVGSAVVDMITPGGLQAIAGNSIKFAIGCPYEQEAGTQISISATTILKFSVIAFAKGGVTGQH
jgi:hypothetical protein